MTTSPDQLSHHLAALEQAYELVLSCRPSAGISHDTVAAIGEAIGALAKARALMGRDIHPQPRLRKRRTTPGLTDTDLLKENARLPS
jgi:hypothetical protein